MTECTLTIPQQVAGYLTLLNLGKVIGSALIAAGFILIFHRAIRVILSALRNVFEVLLYVAAAGLVIGAQWLSPEYQTWSVFTGCLLFMGGVQSSIFIHEIEGDDPQPLAALYTVVWGGVAWFYSSTEVAFLATLALVTLLNFNVVVGQMSYGFGWNKKDQVAPATMASLIILAIGLAGTIFGETLPSNLQTFFPPFIWVGGFVGFLGILIMASRYYSDGASYVWMQMVAITIYGCCLVAGLVFAINPLAGLAGTFAAFYAAEKPLDIKPENTFAIGFCLILSGLVLFFAWQYGYSNQENIITAIQSVGK